VFVIVIPDVDAGLIRMEKFWDCDTLALSVTVSENPNVPGLVGVPEIRPCDALSRRPGGSAPDRDQM
jgi:hypothetical protein